jgi:hypothetical protein
MRPKFEVGEVVILQSEGRPKHNGDQIVTDIKHFSSAINATTGEVITGGVYLYQLADADSGSDGWIESSLRKKHIPGELSFTDLMASLSSPVLITHQPQ